MAGWHHRCNGHELGQTPGDGEGQGGLVCCSSWGHKESGTTKREHEHVCVHVHACVRIFFFRFFFLTGYYKMLSIVLCAVQLVLVIYLFYIVVCMYMLTGVSSSVFEFMKHFLFTT